MNEYMNTQESRFAEPFEIMAVCKKINLHSDEEGQLGGVPVISDGEYMYVESSEANTLVISDPGSGKTRRLCAPTILSLANSSSMVINDPKQELYKMTKTFLEKKGFVVYQLNFREPERGDSYNPLFYPACLYKAGEINKAKEEFLQIGESIYTEIHSTTDPFWEIMAQQLFCAYCLIGCREIKSPDELTFSYIYRMFLEGEEKVNGCNVLKEYVRLIDDSSIYEAIAGYMNSATETKASILAVFSSLLSRLAGANISSLIDNNTFEPELLVNGKVALFITPRDEIGVFNSLLSCVIDQIYKRLLVEAEKTNGVLKRRCEFVLDEFSNLGPIMAFANKISEARSRNIRFHLFVQSYDQLISKYGKENSGVICSCCQNTFYIHSPEISVLENISERCGKHLSEYTHKEIHLLSVPALQHFRKEKGEMLCLLGREHPYVAYLPDFEAYAKKLGLQEANLSNCKKCNAYTPKLEVSFSMKEYVEKKKNEDMEKLFNKVNGNSDDVGISARDMMMGEGFRHIDTKAIIDRIDQKLKELEEEEKAEEEMPDF